MVVTNTVWIDGIFLVYIILLLDLGVLLDVRIKLSPEAYEFLLLQVPNGLTARKALEHAQLIRSRMNYKARRSSDGGAL